MQKTLANGTCHKFEIKGVLKSYLSSIKKKFQPKSKRKKQIWRGRKLIIVDLE
jgi:hypothetical protein